MSNRLENAVVIAIGLCAIFLWILSQNGYLSKLECSYRNGLWQEGARICYYPPSDLNRVCYQDADCSQLCVHQGKDEQGYLLGRCSRSMVVCGTQTIPFRTRSNIDLEENICAQKDMINFPPAPQQRPGSGLQR